MPDNIDLEAIIIPPSPYKPIRFKDYLPKMKNAGPFLEVEFTEKNFLSSRDITIISYLVCANHPRYRALYYAWRTTIYMEEFEFDQVIAHAHRKLAKGELPAVRENA